MDNRRPGSPRERVHESGPVGTALATSIRSNATAFGFSITITISFGALQRLDGSPSLLELLLYGIAAAIAIGLLEGGVTRGFRRRVGTAPAEVSMMGTSMNALSVAVGVGAAIACGELMDGAVAWAVGGFAAAGIYVLAEATEILLAERVQRARGDSEAEREEQ